MAKKTLYGVSAALVIATASVAIAKGKGILYPDWSKPTRGTYDAPAAELGQKSTAEQPWTTTTVSSAIDKPLAGKPITVQGEVIDYSCYMQVGKHGDKHRDCGQKCARNGEPVGILAQDGTTYLLMAEEHNPRRDGKTSFRQMAIDHMAEIVTVNGTASEVNGQKAIYVHGYVAP